VKSHVQLRHIRYNDAESCMEDMGKYCNNPEIDFVDGVAFSDEELYIILGTFVDKAPYVSEYQYMNIFYKSIKERNTDYLTTLDYIWRWDSDWFWCSRGFYLQVPIVRLLLAPFVLRSNRFMRIWRASHKVGVHNKKTKEFVIQDVEIPLHNCVEFLKFFHKTIGIEPVWMCPVRPTDTNYSLYPVENCLHVNFGFWDAVNANPEDPNWHNKQLESKVIELEGAKSLYSSVFFTEEQFWKKYNKSSYDKVKAKYDPHASMLNLYAKCVGNQ